MFEDNNSLSGRIESGIQGGLLWVLISSACSFAWRNKILIVIWLAVYSLFCQLTGRTEMREQMWSFPKDKLALTGVSFKLDQNSDSAGYVTFSLHNNGPVRVYDIYASCTFTRTASDGQRTENLDTGYAYGYLGPDQRATITLPLMRPAFKPESATCTPSFEVEKVDMLKLPEYQKRSK